MRKDNQKPKKGSLSKKIGITIVVLAVPIFVISLNSFYSQVRELLHREAVERSYSYLNTTMQRMVNYMNRVEMAARSNAWLLEENFNPDSLQVMSRRIVRLNPSVQSCSVSTEPDVFPEYGHYFSVYSVNEGDTIYTVSEPDFEYFERIWYKTALQTGKASWVDPFSDFSEGSIDYDNAVASYCIPLRPKLPNSHQPTAGGRERIAGVVSTDFSFNRLADAVFATEHPYPSAYFMMIGEGGRYLIHPNANNLYKKTIFTEIDSIEHPDVIALGHEMIAGKRGTMHVTFDKDLYHVCYAPVPGTHWSLALVSLDDDVLIGYMHLTYLVILLIVIGLIGIVWLTSMVVRHNIRPINQLLEATNEIANGHIDNVIPPSNGKDVVSQLQNAFRQMQQSLISKGLEVNQTFEELRQQNADQEQATIQAEASAKEKDAFVQSISRHIKKPLNVIEGLANVLHNSLPSRGSDKSVQKLLQKEEMRNLTSTMSRNATLVRRMMLMLFDTSFDRASDKSVYERTDNVACNTIAQECLDFVMTQFPDAEMRLDAEIPDGLSILTNHLYLMRTLRELLYNAAKFSDGKHIVLRTKQTTTAVRFIVEDIGPGLPKDAQRLIDEPFEKAIEQSEGLGLGLPLCKRHTVSLGGEFIYDTDYTEGCRITVELPKGGVEN